MNNWTSVKDRLPENNGYFLVYTLEGIKGFDDVMLFYYCGNDEWDNGQGMASSNFYRITHWMAPPAPPESEGTQ